MAESTTNTQIIFTHLLYREMMTKEILKDWLFKLYIEQDVAKSIVAYCFNLFEVESGYGFYLSGASSYDEDDDDWACDPCYQSGYLELKGDGFQDMEWQSFLDNMVNAVRECISSTESFASFFNGKIVTVGFEDGDLVRVF